MDNGYDANQRLTFLRTGPVCTGSASPTHTALTYDESREIEHAVTTMPASLVSPREIWPQAVRRLHAKNQSLILSLFHVGDDCARNPHPAAGKR